MIFILFGSQAEFDYAESLRKDFNGLMFNMCGKLSVYGAANLLGECDLYLGNDTGTMHIAAMAGTSCLALFSARDYPGQWYPYGNKHKVFRKPVDCEGCMLEVCDRDNLCLRKISVGEVCKVAIEVLQ